MKIAGARHSGSAEMSPAMGNTGLRFANLLREVCFEHGGTFIAVQDL